MLDRLTGRMAEVGLLSETEAAALAGLRFQPRSVRAREDFDRGEGPVSVHVVLSGVACRYRIWEDGQRRILSLLVPGDLCDGHAPLPYAMQTRVAALTPCTVGTAPSQAMAELIREHPGIARALWLLTLVKLGVTQAWLANVGREADRRIAHLMCEMLVRLKCAGMGDESGCEWPLTQTDLAEVLGLSPVHVCRVLHGMRAAGLVGMTRRRLSVPDVGRLRRFAGFDPSYLIGGIELPEAPPEPELRRA